MDDKPLPPPPVTSAAFSPGRLTGPVTTIFHRISRRRREHESIQRRSRRRATLTSRVSSPVRSWSRVLPTTYVMRPSVVFCREMIGRIEVCTEGQHLSDHVQKAQIWARLPNDSEAHVEFEKSVEWRGI
jgi:hypothetical protein